MNSRQYEAMRLEQHEENKTKAIKAAHNKLIRHLKRKSDDALVEDYFNGHYNTIKEVKAMVRAAGWTWEEAKKCNHRNLNYFLDPVINVCISKTDREKYKKMFKKDMAFAFVRDFVQEIYWNPTLDDIIDFLETTAILLKDPDHCGLADIHFLKDQYDDNGNNIDYYVVTFSLDS